MAIQVIEQYLPKSAAYINWVLKNDSEKRCGHHNYVAGQYVINLLKPLSEQTAKDLLETDESLFSKLHNLDNNPDCVLIDSYEEFTDFAEIVDVYGQGCNYPTNKGVDGFQIDFDVVAIKDGIEKSFHIVYQTSERSCNITAYNGFEMEPASGFGCDADESCELTEFMDYDYSVFSEMRAIADKLCRDWLESNQD